MSFFDNLVDNLLRKKRKEKNKTKYNLLYRIIMLWKPKMCRLAWQLLGMLGNVLGLLGMLCNVLGMLATSSASSACFPQGLRSPTSKKYPPTCCLISCEAKGVVYHQVSQASLHILGYHNNIIHRFFERSEKYKRGRKSREESIHPSILFGCFKK